MRISRKRSVAILAFLVLVVVSWGIYSVTTYHDGSFFVHGITNSTTSNSNGTRVTITNISRKHREVLVTCQVDCVPSDGGGGFLTMGWHAYEIVVFDEDNIPVKLPVTVETPYAKSAVCDRVFFPSSFSIRCSPPRTGKMLIVEFMGFRTKPIAIPD